MMTMTARSAAKRVIRTVSSAAVRAVAVDSTQHIAARSCLVIAPHPDDETLGCGSTIARLRSRGTDVRVVFVTGGGESPRPDGMSVAELITLRRAEAARALDILGVPETCIVNWDFEDGELSSHADDITFELTDLVRTTTPDQVLVTSVRDRHPDHVAVARSTRAALSPLARPPVLYEYPIWQRVPALMVALEAARAGRGRRREGAPRAVARPRLVQAGEFLAKKSRAISAYESQLPHFPVGFVDDFLLAHESYWEITLRP